MSICHTVLLSTADSQLGRVDYSLLSDQALMEMLIEEISDAAKKKYQDKDGMYIDVCDWERIKCDADGNVIKVYDIEADGTISLSYIPPKVWSFQMFMRGVHGTLETSALQPSLKVLKIAQNKFHGTVNFATLPPNMVKLGVYKNAFTGSVNLESLPDSLTHLWIFRNKFSGTLCLKKLPPKFKYFEISDNAFSGDFHLQNVPATLEALYAHENQFNAIAVVPEHCVTNVHLEKSGVTSVITCDGDSHPHERQILGVSSSTL